MAIAITNEWSTSKDNLVSPVVSAHCRPKILFTATTAAASAVVTLTINSVTLELSAILIDTDGSFTYWLSDVSDILKYFMVANGVTDVFEVLDDGIQTSAMTGDLDIDIETFNNSSVSIESDSFTYQVSHLWHDIPQETGFNLWPELGLRKMYPQKWCNDTYNALYLLNAGCQIQAKDKGGEYLELAARSFVGATIESTQFKFVKRVQNFYDLDSPAFIYNSSGHNAITYTGTKTIVLADLAPGAINNGDVVKSVRVIIDNKTVVSDNANEYVSLVVTYSDASTETFIVYQENTNYGFTYDYDYTITLNPSKKFSQLVFIPFGYTGTPATRIGSIENIRLLIEIDNKATTWIASNNIVMAPGINDVYISIGDDGNASTLYDARAHIEIDFDPYGCYIPLVWFHRSMGFVSYPFEGAKIEGVETDERGELDINMNTLVNINQLKESLGKISNERVTLTSQVEKKYWPLIKDLFVNRQAFMWVGQYGDIDDPTKWLAVSVEGEFEINNNVSKSSALITVELKLPEQFNAKY